MMPVIYILQSLHDSCLKVELEKTKVTKEKLKVVVTRVKKECNRLKDVITAK